MDLMQLVARHKIKEDKEKETEFYAKCDILGFAIENNLLKVLPLNKYLSLYENIFNKIEEFKHNHRSEIVKVYYFQSGVDLDDICMDFQPKIPMYEYVNRFYNDKLRFHEESIGKYFSYFIVEYKVDKSKTEIVSLLNSEVERIYSEFDVLVSPFDSMSNRDLTNYHAHYQGIMVSHKLGAKKSKKPNKIEVNAPISKPQSMSSVGDFVGYVDDSLQTIMQGGDIFHAVKFVMQDTREYKYLREEYIIIKSYILSTRVSFESKIKLGEEKERWDAKISGATTELLEVTQATPKFEYETRKSLAYGVHQYRGLSLDLRTKHQKALDHFSEVIISAIEDKHNKNYNEPRVLLVGALFEFFSFDEEILEKTVEYVAEKTELGIFSSIYLVVDGNRCIKIH